MTLTNTQNVPELAQIADLVRSSDNFLIVGHVRPDGDCLGSCLGLTEILKILGKQVRFYTEGPLPLFLAFLPGFEMIETDFPHDETFGAVLSVDTADANRVFLGYEPQGMVAVIDHHTSNTRYGTINWIDGSASAAAEMIHTLAGALGVEINERIATCLYTGIMTDTGSFRFANTTEHTFRVASELVSKGADPAQIAEEVYASRPPAAVKISSLVMSTLNYEFDGALAWNEITQQMLVNANATEAQAEGLSSEMRTIEGVQISVLFYETPEGQCRIGFRSRGDLNVSTLASLLGGGGHPNASGASVAEDYLMARKRALDIIREFVADYLKK